MIPKLKALLNQIQSGKRMSDNARVLDYVMKHQTASARISDLLDIGVIENKGNKETATSTFSYLKYQPNILNQTINAKKRKQEKYKNWLRKGMTQFSEYINPQLKQELQHESIN